MQYLECIYNHLTPTTISTAAKNVQVATSLLACVAGGIRGHKGGSLKYRLPKN